MSDELPRAIGEDNRPHEEVIGGQLHIGDGQNGDVGIMLAKLESIDRATECMQLQLRSVLEHTAHSERKELQQTVTELEERNAILEATLLERTKKVYRLEATLRDERKTAANISKQLDELSNSFLISQRSVAPKSTDEVIVVEPTE